MKALFCLVLLFLPWCIALPAQALLPVEKLAELTAIDFGELTRLADPDPDSPLTGMDEVVGQIAPFRKTLSPFLREETEVRPGTPPPAFLAQVPVNDLRRTAKGLAGIAWWLAVKGKHREAFQLLQHGQALALLVANRAARPWSDTEVGGNLLGAMISVAMRKVIVTTAGAIIARTSPDPALARKMAVTLRELELSCPDFRSIMASEVGFARQGLKVLAAADPQNSHTAWLTRISSPDTAFPLLPPGLERSFQQVVEQSPEARAVLNLQVADASREINLYASRMAALTGQDLARDLHQLDELDLDFTSRRVYRNLYVQMIAPNFRRAFLNFIWQRCRTDILLLAAELMGGAPPRQLPERKEPLLNPQGLKPYGYECSGTRFLLYTDGPMPARQQEIIERFHKNQIQGLTFEEGVTWCSDQGFLK